MRPSNIELLKGFLKKIEEHRANGKEEVKVTTKSLQEGIGNIIGELEFCRGVIGGMLASAEAFDGYLSVTKPFDEAKDYLRAIQGLLTSFAPSASTKEYDEIARIAKELN